MKQAEFIVVNIVGGFIYSAAKIKVLASTARAEQPVDDPVLAVPVDCVCVLWLSIFTRRSAICPPPA